MEDDEHLRRVRAVEVELRTVKTGNSSLRFQRLCLVTFNIAMFGVLIYYGREHTRDLQRVQDEVADNVARLTQKMYEEEQLGLALGIHTQITSNKTFVRLRDATSFPRPIWGLATLDDKLYVLMDRPNQVYVFDVVNGVVNHDTYNLIDVPGLGNVLDMTSSKKSNCIYISDGKYNVIHRISREGEVTSWSVLDQPHGLSVNAANHLLVTCPTSRTIKEFTSHGHLFGEIQLNADLVSPWHTIELEHNAKNVGTRFLVSHGGRSDIANGIAVIDQRGDLLGYRKLFLVPISSPIRVQKVGAHVVVADENNRRVLMFTTDLVYAWNLVSELRGALRLWMDAAHDQLFVAVNKWQNDAFVSGILRVYAVL